MSEPIINPADQPKSSYTYENISELFDAAKAPPLPDPALVVAETETEQTSTETPVVDVSSKTESDEDEVSDAPASAAAAAKAAIRTFKVRIGESDVDLPEDIKLTHKADGKPLEITLGEALRRASGDVSIERKYENFRKEQEAFVEARELAKAATDAFSELRDPVEKKDFLSFLIKAPEALGVDPVEFETAILDALGPLAAKWVSLSAAEKKSLVDSRKIDVLEKKTAETTAAQEQDRKNRETSRVVAEFCRDNGIEQQVFASALSEVKKLKDDGQLPNVERITPQTVHEYITLKSLETRSISALAKVNPTLAEDPETIRDLMQSVLGQNPTDEDLDEIVRAVHGADLAEQKLNRKLNKSVANGEAKPPPPKPKRPKEEERSGFNPNEFW